MVYSLPHILSPKLASELRNQAQPLSQWAPLGEKAIQLLADISDQEACPLLQSSPNLVELNYSAFPNKKITKGYVFKTPLHWFSQSASEIYQQWGHKNLYLHETKTGNFCAYSFQDQSTLTEEIKNSKNHYQQANRDFPISKVYFAYFDVKAPQKNSFLLIHGIFFFANARHYLVSIGEFKNFELLLEGVEEYSRSLHQEWKQGIIAFFKKNPSAQEALELGFGPKKVLDYSTTRAEKVLQQYLDNLEKRNGVLFDRVYSLLKYMTEDPSNLIQDLICGNAINFSAYYKNGQIYASPLLIQAIEEAFRETDPSFQNIDFLLEHELNHYENSLEYFPISEYAIRLSLNRFLNQINEGNEGWLTHFLSSLFIMRISCARHNLSFEEEVSSTFAEQRFLDRSEIFDLSKGDLEILLDQKTIQYQDLAIDGIKRLPPAFQTLAFMALTDFMRPISAYFEEQSINPASRSLFNERVQLIAEELNFEE